MIAPYDFLLHGLGIDKLPWYPEFVDQLTIPWAEKGLLQIHDYGPACFQFVEERSDFLFTLESYGEGYIVACYKLHIGGHIGHHQKAA